MAQAEGQNVRAHLLLPSRSVTDIPIARLVVQGDPSSMTAGGGKNRGPSQRALIFVIDKSGSMSGSRMNNVRQSVINFVKPICSDNNLIITIVMFQSVANSFRLSRDPDTAEQQLNTHMRATGGTSFEAAGKCLVEVGQELLQQFPGFEQSVIMCSDGQVAKANAIAGQTAWKNYVRGTYCERFGQNPFVTAIGISRDHDADVLDGFICSDDTGNYTRAVEPKEIYDAFVSASEEAILRVATRLQFEFPFDVCADIYNGSVSRSREVIAVSEEVEACFWIPRSSVDDDVKEVEMHCNEIGIRVQVRVIEDAQEVRNIEADYYVQLLKDMLGALRSTTEESQLRTRATEIEQRLQDLEFEFERITSSPPGTTDLREEIAGLLDMNEDVDDEEAHRRRLHLADLMKRYRDSQKSWRQHKAYVMTFKQTLNSLKDLIKEISLGQVRLQEIRQHILDMHFRKKHAKRMNDLVLSEEQLEARQERYDAIVGLDEAEVGDVSDDFGSGCFLSTMSLRDIAMDGDALWVVGRVKWIGGTAVSNPELIKIEYISPNTVSDSFFRMALEAKKNAGFLDGSRRIVNARLFPIFGNMSHFQVSRAYLFEGLSHSASGRNDIAVVDLFALWAVVGRMIATETMNEANLKRLFEVVMPSFLVLARNFKSYPYATAHSRDPDTSADKIPLTELCRERLRRYMRESRCRTTSLVSNVHVLFADLLLHFADASDRGEAFELLTEVVGNDRLWWGMVLQRLRRAVAGQIPRGEDVPVAETQRVELHQGQVMRVIVRGVENVRESSTDGADCVLATSAVRGRYDALFDVPEMDILDPDALPEWSANTITPSSCEMCAQLIGRVDFDDLIQARRFFVTLVRMKDGEDALAQVEAFKTDTSGGMNMDMDVDDEAKRSDVNMFCEELGRNETDVQFVRGLCCVALRTPTNKGYQNQLDLVDELFENDPRRVLETVHDDVVVPQIRKAYVAQQEELRRAELRRIHTTRFFPDSPNKYGKLPYLRCGHSACGQEFNGHPDLLDHLEEFGGRAHALHVKCRSILQWETEISFEGFMEKVSPFFADGPADEVESRVPECRAYFDMYLPLFVENAKRPPIDTSTKVKSSFDEALYRDESKVPVNAVFVGQVSSGKSSVVMQCVTGSGGLRDVDVDRLRREAEEIGMEREFGRFLMDQCKDERYRHASVHGSRTHFFNGKYLIDAKDVPGLRCYVKNLIRNASQSDVAVLVVSAVAGEFEESVAKRNTKQGEEGGSVREHMKLCHVLGAQQVIVVVNKMDDYSVAFSEERFREIEGKVSAILVKIGFKAKKIPFIPICAWTGANITHKSPQMAWWNGWEIRVKKEVVNGMTLLDAFESAVSPSKKNGSDAAFRMPVQQVMKIKGVGDVVTGTVASGIIRRGADVRFSPSGETGKVLSVERWNRTLTEGHVGMTVGLCLRGVNANALGKHDVMFLDDGSDGRPPQQVTSFTMLAFVQSHPGQLRAAVPLRDGSFSGGFSPVVFVGQERAPCMMIGINWKMGKSTGNEKEKRAQFVEAGDQAEIVMMPLKPMAVEAFDDPAGGNTLGRVVVLDQNVLVMMGKIVRID